jgi:hypothetical protein
MIDRPPADLVLAVYPTARGIGFVLMKGPLAPVDWGVKGVQGSDKNAECVEKVAALIEAYPPDVIALEEPTSPRLTRAERLASLTKEIESFARKQAIDVHRYPRFAVDQCFSQFGARTRHEVAATIAKRVPALERFLPRPRKLWESEDTRMGIFRATALALTYYDLQARDATRNS